VLGDNFAAMRAINDFVFQWLGLLGSLPSMLKEKRDFASKSRA
jgi:hypothetical protein